MKETVSKIVQEIYSQSRGMGQVTESKEISTHNCNGTHVVCPSRSVDTTADSLLLRLSYHHLTKIFFCGCDDGVEVDVDVVVYVDVGAVVDVVGVRALLLNSELVVVLDRLDLSTARLVFHQASVDDCIHPRALPWGLYPLFHFSTAVASVCSSQDSAQHF